MRVVKIADGVWHVESETTPGTWYEVKFCLEPAEGEKFISCSHAKNWSSSPFFFTVPPNNPCKHMLAIYWSLNIPESQNTLEVVWEWKKGVRGIDRALPAD